MKECRERVGEREREREGEGESETKKGRVKDLRE